MTELRVERAVEADLPRIVAISNWAAEHTAANFATAPETLDDWLAAWREHGALHPWFVARAADGSVLGFAKSAPHKSRCGYAWSAEVSVYLDPSVHGRGVGTALYARLLGILEAQGYATVIAGITAGHVASERLHAKMGFVRCATFHRVGFKLGRWHDVGYWEKLLSTGDAAPTPVRRVSDVA
ncbi:MAG: N-acetyltransferase [Labilithrix sp.]|nr:N-acetyltransferase [Labilithrix sp.]MCW5812483.1 N-acetyltransferase [Labilithrix sp.]